jgi:hypothetical protein
MRAVCRLTITRAVGCITGESRVCLEDARDILHGDLAWGCEAAPYS